MHLLVLILRDARTHVRICRTSSACALLRMRTSIADFTVHHVKQPISFPRRVSAPGVCNFASLTPNEGGRSAESRSGAAAPVGRIMTRDARLSALHRGDFGLRGRASVSFGARRPTTAGSCFGSVQRAPRSQVVV